MDTNTLLIIIVGHSSSGRWRILLARPMTPGSGVLVFKDLSEKTVELAGSPLGPAADRIPKRIIRTEAMPWTPCRRFCSGSRRCASCSGSASWCGMRFSAGAESGIDSRPPIQPTHRVRLRPCNERSGRASAAERDTPSLQIGPELTPSETLELYASLATEDAAPPVVSTPVCSRIPLFVPFEQKDLARKGGARWNRVDKVWECTPAMLKRRYEQLRPFVPVMYRPDEAWPYLIPLMVPSSTWEPICARRYPRRAGTKSDAGYTGPPATVARSSEVEAQASVEAHEMWSYDDLGAVQRLVTCGRWPRLSQGPALRPCHGYRRRAARPGADHARQRMRPGGRRVHHWRCMERLGTPRRAAMASRLFLGRALRRFRRQRVAYMTSGARDQAPSTRSDCRRPSRVATERSCPWVEQAGCQLQTLGERQASPRKVGIQHVTGASQG